MAESGVRFYQQHGFRLIQVSLQSVVGQSPQYVASEELFRRLVIDRSWEALPEEVRKRDRKKLRWDDILLGLRLRVYSQADNKVTLLPDAPARIAELLGHLFRTSPKSFTAGMGMQIPPSLARSEREDSPPSAKREKRVPRSIRPGPPHLALGIDLGTTYSAVAYLDAQGRPTCIHNQVGDILTPSVVLFDEGGVVVGKEAVLGGAMQPGLIADLAKRYMGERCYAKKINGYEFPPEAISAFVLRSLKADAEQKLGPVSQAVITCPAYFDEAQRRATIDAGRLADLEVLDILNEPTAAALAHGYQLGFMDWQGALVRDRPLRVLVYDLGGGTFDVTVVHIEESSFKTLAIGGDSHLGGKDWDTRLVDLVVSRVAQQSGADPREDPATMWEITTGCETAKRSLSERQRAAVFVTFGGKRYKVEVTRSEFEDATADLLERTRASAQEVVKQAGIAWNEIDKVLLVGGSTRMPMVPAMLGALAGKVPECTVSPDEAVAHGAALYADLLLQRCRGGAGHFSISNVSAHSLGILVMDAKTHQRCNQIIIPKNSPLPTSMARIFHTWKPNQSKLKIRIVEGESRRPEECSKIGTLRIEDLPANLPQGTPVKIRYTYEENGQLKVTAKLPGHPKVVNTYFLRDNKLDDDQLDDWADWVAAEWERRTG